MNNAPTFQQQFVCSPCCLPQWPYEELLAAYGELGFTKFEAFSEWAQSRLDWKEEPILARQKAENAGLKITSFHLPQIRDGQDEQGLRDAISAARYAEAIGAKVVLFKAATRELYKNVGRRFLDALEEENIHVVPVLQNHHGTAISTIEDYETVFASLEWDSRLKAVLEVGHFQRSDISWRQGWDFLANRIALIHVNEIRDGNSVPYGTGEVDFAGLMKQIKTTNYQGEIVVELELAHRNTEPQQTLEGLKQARTLLTELYEEA